LNEFKKYLTFRENIFLTEFLGRKGITMNFKPEVFIVDREKKRNSGFYFREMPKEGKKLRGEKWIVILIFLYQKTFFII